MTNSTFSNQPNLPPITLESLLETAKELERQFPPQPTIKAIVCSKKHHKQILKQLNALPTSISDYTALMGVPIKFIIKPYLKKIRILSWEDQTLVHAI